MVAIENDSSDQDFRWRQRREGKPRCSADCLLTTDLDFDQFFAVSGQPRLGSRRLKGQQIVRTGEIWCPILGMEVTR